MPKAVKFDKYGGIEVLRVVEVERPVPGPGQVLVQVKAAGINPGEAAIREGAFAKQWPAKKHGAKTDGNAVGASAKVLANLAELIETGRLEIPIARVYPLADVQEAYRELELRHTLGKIVLVP